LSFLLNGPPTLESVQPEVGSSGRKSTATSRGLGSGVPAPNPSAAGGMLELLARRERAAACRPGDGPGTAPSGAFPGRRTTDSELAELPEVLGGGMPLRY
ncbi:hypothetical protein ACJX0J_000827, partial [Zea mays]